MTSVFADTLYWAAILNPGDQYAQAARDAYRLLGPVNLVTTEEVLTELLNSRRVGTLRLAVCEVVTGNLSDDSVTVYPQSHESFLAGLALYRKRADKGYSLVLYFDQRNAAAEHRRYTDP